MRQLSFRVDFTGTAVKCKLTEYKCNERDIEKLHAYLRHIRVVLKQEDAFCKSIKANINYECNQNIFKFTLAKYDKLRSN